MKNKEGKKPASLFERACIITAIGALLLVALIIATVITSDSGANIFITNNERYILSIEIIILAVFLIEMLARIVTLRPAHTNLPGLGSSWRLIIRIIGYTIGFLSVISILAANTTLGISVGVIAGIVIIFATQNIASSVLAAIVIVSTRMIKVGEEITVGAAQGIVADISLTHTVLFANGDAIFVPNIFIVTNVIRRKKRAGKSTAVRNW